MGRLVSHKEAALALLLKVATTVAHWHPPGVTFWRENGVSLEAEEFERKLQEGKSSSFPLLEDGSGFPSWVTPSSCLSLPCSLPPSV